MGDFWTELPIQGYGWRLHAVVGDRIWLGYDPGFGTGEAWCVSLDRQTLETRTATPLASTRHYGVRFAAGDGWVAVSEGRAVVGLDAATGERCWELPGELVAGQADRVVMRPESDYTDARVVLVDGCTGRTLASTPTTAGWRNLGSTSPSALLVGEELLYLGSKALVRLDPQGSVVARLPLDDRDANRSIARIGAQLYLLADRETDAGAVTEIFAVDQQATDLSLVDRVEGRLGGHNGGGDLLVLWTRVNERTGRCTALVPGGPRVGLLSDVTTFAGETAVRRGLAVTLQRGGAEVFRLDGETVHWTRIPLPDFASSVVLDGEALCVVDDRRLIHLDLDRPPETVPHRARPTRRVHPPYYARVVEPAEAGATVEHPDLGALALPGDTSALAERDRVTLDEVSEELPGVWQVRQWRKARGELAEVSVPGDLALDPHSLPEPLPAPVGSRRHTLEALQACAAERGFVVSPLMARVFEMSDTDEVFREWLDYLGLQLEIDGHTNCWLGTDVSIVACAGDGSGQVYGLYLYPPAQRDDEPAPLVYWDHETRDVSWCAHDFDTFFADFLAARGRWDADRVARVLHRLELPADFPREHHDSSPPWFTAAHTEADGSLEEALALVEEDPLRAERMLVALHREDEKSERIRQALEDHYVRLQWPYHLRNLQHATALARR